jgi:hypothetical protein
MDDASGDYRRATERGTVASNLDQPVPPTPAQATAFALMGSPQLSFIFSIICFMHAIFSINIKEEMKTAKLQPMLRQSIGDQILSLLAQDANVSDDPLEKANATRARRIFEDFRTAHPESSSSKQHLREMRRKVLEQLHRVDINPHVLALGWLRQYRRAWSVYIRRRWKEIVAAKDRKLKKAEKPAK